MAESVDHEQALRALTRAWANIPSKKRPPARMQMLIEQVLSAPDITFKYILITGYLGKYVNPSVHSRALQVSSQLDGAYDARSLCHKVVVGFEKNKGNLFGLSNEPFVNKPARHPEHDGANPQLRNKIIAHKLHEALEAANSAPRQDTYLGLVHILRIGAQNAASHIQVHIETQISLPAVTGFIDMFLQKTDGGARLVAVWAAIMALITEEAKISVTSPNTSDQFGQRAGDVEIHYEEVLVAASECKHRPLNLDDVKHGLSKAIERGVPEYHFVIAAGVKPGQTSQIEEELAAHSGKLDLLLVDIWQSKTLLAGILNPIRRARFGGLVVGFLRDMRKFKSADIAAELWNAVTS